jgi:hypothetical protein
MMKLPRILLAALALGLALGACSSASGEPAQSAKPTTTTTGKAVRQDATVTISAKGFAPYWADVPLHSTVTFENTTATPQQIVFDNARDASGAPLQSQVIAPGATWVWTADTFASFAYHSPQLPGQDGRIQVDPPAEP